MRYDLLASCDLSEPRPSSSYAPSNDPHLLNSFHPLCNQKSTPPIITPSLLSNLIDDLTFLLLTFLPYKDAFRLIMSSKRFHQLYQDNRVQVFEGLMKNAFLPNLSVTYPRTPTTITTCEDLFTLFLPVSEWSRNVPAVDRGGNCIQALLPNYSVSYSRSTHIARVLASTIGRGRGLYYCPACETAEDVIGLVQNRSTTFFTYDLSKATTTFSIDGVKMSVSEVRKFQPENPGKHIVRICCGNACGYEATFEYNTTRVCGCSEHEDDEVKDELSSTELNAKTCSISEVACCTQCYVETGFTCGVCEVAYLGISKDLNDPIICDECGATLHEDDCSDYCVECDRSFCTDLCGGLVFDEELEETRCAECRPAEAPQGIDIFDFLMRVMIRDGFQNIRPRGGGEGEGEGGGEDDDEEEIGL